MVERRLYRAILRVALQIEKCAKVEHTIERAVCSGAVSTHNMTWATRHEERLQDMLKKADEYAQQLQPRFHHSKSLPFSVFTNLRPYFQPALQNTPDEPQKIEMLLDHGFKVLRETSSYLSAVDKLVRDRTFEPKTRPDNLKYRVGQLLEHDKFGDAVVMAWDETCAMSDDWIRDHRVDEIFKGGRSQPFYRVICRDGRIRYCPEESLSENMREPFFHRQMRTFFEGCFEGEYIPKKHLRMRFPVDAQKIETKLGRTLDNVKDETGREGFDGDMFANVEEEGHVDRGFEGISRRRRRRQKVEHISANGNRIRKQLTTRRRFRDTDGTRKQHRSPVSSISSRASTMSLNENASETEDTIGDPEIGTQNENTRLGDDMEQEGIKNSETADEVDGIEEISEFGAVELEEGQHADQRHIDSHYHGNMSISLAALYDQDVLFRRGIEHERDEDTLLEYLQSADPLVLRAIENKLVDLWTELHGRENKEKLKQARLAIRDAKFTDAKETLDELAQTFPDWKEVDYHKAKLSWAQGERDSCIEICDAILATKPHHFPSMQLKAKCALQSHSAAVAKNALLELKSLMPHSPNLKTLEAIIQKFEHEETGEH